MVLEDEEDERWRWSWADSRVEEDEGACGMEVGEVPWGMDGESLVSFRRGAIASLHD